jgi:TonB family protein
MVPPTSPGLAIALAIVAGGACRRPPNSLGTIHVGASGDPGFEQTWRALTGDDREVFYIEDDRPRGRDAHPAAAAVAGGPPPEEVTAVVRANLLAVQTCYLRLTSAGSGVSGRAIVSFTVDGSGRVAGVRVEAPAFKDTGLPRCVSEEVQRWKFPRSRLGGLAVSYPFVFAGG